MDQTRKFYSIPALVGVAVFLLSVPAAAIDGAQVSAGPTALSFALEGMNERVVLTVGGPEGLRFKRTFEAGLTPTFELFDEAGNRYPDGGYTWELWAAPARATRTREQPAYGIEARVRTEVLASGDFTIAEGGFVNPQRTEEVRAKAVEVPAKDFVVEQGDLIVDGSTCIGVDCYYNGESFNFDTLRLKENNLRIHFQDTSSTAAFPSSDWRITVNDTHSGGANKFSIDDVDSNRSPFTIEAGAREHSLYVEIDGDIGLGTKDPERNLHIVSGNTPALRLEQNGSAGFIPQTWDVGANEANFYVSDATDGYKLPLRIKPKAPTNSLFIAADGNVGIGSGIEPVIEPDNRLHVTDNANIDVAKIESDGNQTRLLLENNSQASAIQWAFSVNGNPDEFRVSKIGSGSTELKLDTSGNMTLRGSITTGGATCGGGCDRVFQPGYELESIAEHAAYMWENSHLRGVGPTVENQPFDLTEKTGGMLNELETAHIYIEQLHTTITQLHTTIQEMESRLRKLESSAVQ